MITKNRVDIRKSAEEDSKSLFLKREHMKTIIYDMDKFYDSLFKSKYENVIYADGKYAPCQGCFGCWTKHPAQCYLKDPLKMVCRLIGKTDELVIVTENYYGAYSSSVKNVLDRSIGLSTPFSTYRVWIPRV